MIIFYFAATISAAWSLGSLTACDEEGFKLSALKWTVAQNPCLFRKHSGDNQPRVIRDF
jgi:hypothetical protein